MNGERYINRNPYFRLALIALLLIVAVYIDLSDKILGNTIFERNVPISLGLDLRGGLQALLEVPDGVAVTADQLDVAKTILESRANALGVSEITMQVAPPRRIIAEFPGITNPEEVVASLKQTGLLEFVDMGDDIPPDGSVVKTDYAAAGTKKPTATSAATSTAATGSTATPGTGVTATPLAGATAAPTVVATPEKVYHTIMTGAGLDTAVVSTDGAGNIAIDFTLKGEESKIFADYTTNNVNKILAIVLDGKVISAPRINGPITGGHGNITGNFTPQTANDFVIQLRYGSLPVPIQVVSSQTVGATLGAESVRKSVLAGAIGLLIVILFMILYYRLPGVVAALALITYAVISLAIFKAWPIVLTLPGIAGFILSIGMAVDANILIFERMKEEMRSGKILEQAIDLGFRRAWSSIRDLNLSTLITCLILFIFGSAFGASMVQGFSITLALGVLVSLFTATFVTRTYLHAILDRL